MAFKFCNSFMNINKIEKLFFEASFKLSSCYFSNSISTQKHRFLENKNPIVNVLFINEQASGKINKFLHVSSFFTSKVIPFKLSDIGEGIIDVVIKEWFVQPGDKISQFDPICEVQSDKASVTISSRYDGIVKKLHYEIDATAKVGEALIDIELSEEVLSDEKIEKADVKTSQHETEETNLVKNNILHQDKALATPAVRKLAKENNINLTTIKGSGKEGRILKEDILSHLESKDSNLQALPSLKTSVKILQENQDTVIAITGIKKAMVKSMTAAWNIPHFSYCDEVDATELINIKEYLKKLGQSKEVKITFMPLFIKAVSLALIKYPILNSHVDEKCENIIMKRSHNIGVAIDSNHGLVVPNIKNVEKLDVFEIAKELNRLQELAAKGRLSLDDVSGGTFTLSNIGNIGGTYTKPIIFPPQVVIGGLGKIQVLPRFNKKKEVVESHVFNISWSADHRVVDGATMARFSNLWKLYVGHPELLFHL